MVQPGPSNSAVWTPTSALSNMRIREVAVIAVCFFLLEAALWSAPSRQILLGICAIVAMTVATFARGLSLRELGVDRSAWHRGLWIIGAAVVLAMAMLTVAVFAGTLQLASSRVFGFRTLTYGIWAFQQQFMLLSFIFVGVERAFDAPKAVVACGLLFGIAHLPNPLLVVAALFIGPLFALAFARYRNVYVLAVAHTILGLTLAVTVPEEMHHHMRVGWGYSRYEIPAPVRSKLPSSVEVSVERPGGQP